MLLARPLTVVLTPGFSGERLELAVTLLRIMFPGIGFLVLSAWCLGHPQQPPAVLPVLRGPGALERRPDRVRRAPRPSLGAAEEGIATALAWGVVVGGLLQLARAAPDRPIAWCPNLRLSLDRALARRCRA